jgi:hypothetical protein
MSGALRNVARLFGPVNAIIAHSFGVNVSAHAIIEGLQTNRLVAISPPATLKGLLDKFCRTLRIPAAVQQRLEDRFESDFGSTIWQKASVADMVKTIKLPGLIVHDKHDYDVPWQEAESIHVHWPQSELFLTSQLGHRRILRSRNVIQRVANFLD